MFRVLTLRSSTSQDNQMSTEKFFSLSSLLRHVSVVVVLLLSSILHISAENEVMNPRAFDQKPLDRDVRLRGGKRAYEGRIEIYMESDQQWHTICDTPPEPDFYHLVCRVKGYGHFLEAVKFKPSDLSVLPGYFVCSKEYTHLRSCTLRETEGCSNSEEIGISCSGSDLRCGPIPLSNSRDVEVGNTKFVPSYPENTRVEIVCKADRSISGIMRCVDRAWRWDTQEPDCPEYIDESALCSAPMIDTQTAFMHPLKLFYKYGETIEIVCRDRSQKTVMHCGSNGKLECAEGTDGCMGGEPVAPTCLSPMPDPSEQTVVLAGGKHDAEGRVLVKKGEEWGSICADGWDSADANVVCRQLGFGPARKPANSPLFPAGNKRYFYTSVSCSTSHRDIHLCQMTTVVEKCTLNYEAEVICIREELPCQPPVLPGNAVILSEYKHIYWADDLIKVGCKDHSNTEEKSWNWTCSPTGTWEGTTDLPCEPLPSASNARECSGPPYLSPNTKVEPRKVVYQGGETVVVSCSSLKSASVASSVTLTCDSNGLWRGEIPPDCDPTGHVSGDVQLVLATGMLLVLLQAVIIIGQFCFFKRRHCAAAAEQRPDGALHPAKDAELPNQQQVPN